MASEEVNKAEPLRVSAGSTLGGQAKPECVNNSDYQLMEGSQDHQKGVLQALGAVQILNGVVILALGIFLGSSEFLTHFFRHFFFFTFYTGYPLWGSVFFISSGSLTVVAGRKSTRMLMQNSFGMNIASATIAFVGIVFLLIHLVLNNQAFRSCPSSRSPDLCNYLGSSSNGLVSLMLIFTLLELCITISLSAMWCKGNCCDSREEISSLPSSMESGIPPNEGNSESIKT
ncbi:membrane-spanning 4-domains subfamily A member 3 [Marmota marmota marmota]|uniref:membrane-spanning 4-domains subfamily A member 3 n=1 Tax=Marmota marmota marmota TaxID=9994 RepID=UPI0007626424|nr:membrane-spanning 4-domains subfamily A member 3 [Marmota marmota marmota]